MDNENTDDLPLNTKVVYFDYAEVVSILEEYLRDTGELEDGDVVLDIDAPIPLNEDGVFEIEIEVVSDPTNLLKAKDTTYGDRVLEAEEELQG